MILGPGMIGGPGAEEGGWTVWVGALPDIDLQRYRRAFPYDGADDELGLHQVGPVLHAEDPIAHPGGGGVEAPAVVPDSQFQVLVIEADPEGCLRGPGIFYKIVDPFLI